MEVVDALAGTGSLSDTSGLLMAQYRAQKRPSCGQSRLRDLETGQAWVLVSSLKTRSQSLLLMGAQCPNCGQMSCYPGQPLRGKGI